MVNYRSAGFFSDLLLDMTALQLPYNKPLFFNVVFLFPLVNKSLFVCRLVSFKVSLRHSKLESKFCQIMLGISALKLPPYRDKNTLCLSRSLFLSQTYFIYNYFITNIVFVGFSSVRIKLSVAVFFGSHRKSILEMVRTKAFWMIPTTIVPL